MSKLTGKVALVTGGSRGAAIVEQAGTGDEPGFGALQVRDGGFTA